MSDKPAEKVKNTTLSIRIPTELYEQLDDYRWEIGANDPSKRFTNSELVAAALSEYMAAHR